MKLLSQCLKINLVADIDTLEAFENPNEVMDKELNALYFSRKKGVLEVPMKKQVCVIPFTRDFLLEYNQMEPTPLEIIDMMRMVPTKYITKCVDTKEDLEQVEEMINYIENICD